MKKFLTLIATVILSLSANAQLSKIYVAANATATINGEKPGWELANAVEVNAVDGKFTIVCENVIQMGISDMKTTDWAVWPQHLYKPTVEFTKTNIGTPVDIAGPGAGDLYFPWQGDWTIEMDTDMTYITCTPSTPRKPGIFHLVGGNFGWSFTDTNKFEDDANDWKVYWLNVRTPLTAKQLNVVHNQSWTYWWYPTSAPIATDGTECTWNEQGQGGESKDATLLTDFTGSVRIEVPSEINHSNNLKIAFFSDFHESTDVKSLDYNANLCTEYYNLQGVKVSVPESGNVYIVRHGDKVSKQIVK